MTKLALVTGGASGIGFSAARRLLNEGWTVAISGRNEERLQAAREQLGHSCFLLPANVANGDEMRSAVDRLISEQGPIGALVANAGMNVGRRAWGEISHADFRDVVSTNLLGTYHSVDAVLPGMRANGGGRIVVVSSFAGWYVTPQPGPAYTSTKLAMRGLVESLNMSEILNGVVATALCPGEVATPAMQRRVPPPPPEVLAKMLQPDDIAGAISYILGQPGHVAINELVITPRWNNAYNRIPRP
ncbi:SDR family oxidoreductase [Pelagibacterium sp.]|uniref:SDR family oxidoreductase n=1 Tax=Pelagibacterium sp. TaxID=1967288 RepID=UPI003A8E4A64